MDIKDLNKPQLILLAVLLSFITSIATGITTVTLMQQAPASFTVPVNRVIQQTVEKIQQVEGKTITQTVVVKEEDLVVDAIAKNKSAVFSLTKEAQDPDGKDIEASVGRGFAVSTDGMIVADTMSVLFCAERQRKIQSEICEGGQRRIFFFEIRRSSQRNGQAYSLCPSFRRFR